MFITRKAMVVGGLGTALLEKTLNLKERECNLRKTLLFGKKRNLRPTGGGKERVEPIPEWCLGRSGQGKTQNQSLRVNTHGRQNSGKKSEKTSGHTFQTNIELKRRGNSYGRETPFREQP